MVEGLASFIHTAPRCLHVYDLDTVACMHHSLLCAESWKSMVQEATPGSWPRLQMLASPHPAEQLKSRAGHLVVAQLEVEVLDPAVVRAAPVAAEKRMAPNKVQCTCQQGQAYKWFVIPEH